MDPTDENVQTLLAMGFPSESEVRRALKMAKNDMNEAVDILTNGHCLPSYDDLSSPTSMQDAAMEATESQDFPATNLYELEGRVFTDSWSIPYKEDESLAKCMFASIRLLKEGRADQDDLCSRFLDKCLPDAFKKLLNSQAICKWAMDIQEGVYDMILILVELVAAALELPSKGEQTYIPHILLETLTLSFNYDAIYHQKNKNNRTKLENWEELMGEDRVICLPKKVSTGLGSGAKEYLWLANLVNKFHYHCGLEMITDIICLPKTNIHGMASLTEPLAACVEFLEPKQAALMLEKSIKRIFLVVEHLGADDFRDKNIGKACDLLRNAKVICSALWPNQEQEADRKRLSLVLKMIKCPHFNAKMNALIEITKMIEDSTAVRLIPGAIPIQMLTQWMADQELLGIILSGSIDQAQYCDKVKKIVEHVGPHLSREDLEKLWNRTADQTSHVVDNIHGIFAAAASQFTVDQFTAFTQLLTNNWYKEKDAMKEKHIALLGQIGKETKNHELAQKVIEVMGDLSHRTDISRHLVDKCLDEMYNVLVDSDIIKDAFKKKLLEKCIDSIKRKQWIMPALKQLLNLVKHIVKQSMTKADRSKAITDIQKSTDIIKLLVTSLISSHQTAVLCSTQLNTSLGPDLILDGKYSHKEHVEEHLLCLTFILQEYQSIFMSWNRVKDFWECMVNNKDACDWDRQTCYTWLTDRIAELEPEAVTNLFTKKLMTGQTCKLTSEGFLCWRTFFEQTNLREHNLRKVAGSIIVDKQDLIGLEELWGLCLNVSDSEVAQEAITFLLQNIYINLNSKFKKDSADLHKSFIKDCHERLEALLISLRGGGSVVYTSLSQAFYQLTAIAIPALEKLPTPMKAQYLLNIERLLSIVEQYVLTVEEVYQLHRSSPPHGASFYGYPITVTCECENTKELFIIKTHRNESVMSFKTQLGDKVQRQPESITFNQTELKGSKDQRLLGQLGLVDGKKITFRYPYTSTSAHYASSSVSSEAASTSSTVAVAAASPVKLGTWDLEKSLPGVLIAQNGQVFRLLYQLAEIGDQKITQRVAALLDLIPTDPAVLEMVDNIGLNRDVESNPGSAISTPSHSPSPSPRKVRAATGATYGSQTSMLSRKSSNSSRIVNLFTTKAGTDVSPFRVRYNLEVLSARIMPLDMPSSRPNSKFCAQFLSNNGLSYIMQVFQPDYFTQDVDPNIRQACYSLALQLLSYMLCGETVKESDGLSEMASSQIMSGLDPTELIEMISCMMRVAWAASIGKLHLSNSMQPAKDLNLYGRLRQNSADSSTSSSSDTEITCLHAGVCLSQTDVDAVNTSIAVKAFEILLFCLKTKPSLIGSFYTLPCVADFLLDVLTGCCREEIRIVAADGLKILADIKPTYQNVEPPKYFLLKVTLQARLPYWVNSACTRGARQRLLAQCLQYFELRCHLMAGLSLVEQKMLSVNVASMIEDEIAWLSNFNPNCSAHTSDLAADDVLLTGHLRLIKHLLTCESVSYDDHSAIVSLLLDDFLFPAAKLELSADTHDSLADFSPKCTVALSQEAAYEVLVELCSHSRKCLQDMADKLITWHHSTIESSEWEYMPPVEGRAHSGFVGLKNGGATCYMNSVIQQLYMLPGVVDNVLSVDDEEIEESGPSKAVFNEIQQVFGHLLDSQLQYFEPDQLWHEFKLWGQSVNVREQQDAFDFLTALCDQLDETLKSSGRDPVFQQKLQGVYSDQKNCEDCSHKYEREEPFLALNLTVSNPSLEESLDQFVRGELLEGDNAYFCEKCNLKRNAIKRMRIKTLPPVLCIHLKRFSFDWESNRALKFDDFFKFPVELDMAPYTTDGKRAVYELVGMVVHTGQASAGHYYSFIKDRRGSPKSNESYGKWYKFNDTTVEEFSMTEEAMATECFGGRYKAKNTDNGGTKLPEDRVRYWNAYLLFYERKVLQTRSHGNRRSSRIQMLRKSQSSPSARHDSLSELSDLVQKGETHGVFSSKMPGQVQRSVRIKNLEFLRNRNVYSKQYFDFMYNLACIKTDNVEVMDILAKTALKFLLNTYLKTKETLRGDMRRWLDWVKAAFQRCPHTIAWYIDYVAEDPHKYIVPYLLVCGIKDIREFFSTVLKLAAENYVNHLHETNQQDLQKLDILLETLLALLNREVVDNSKNAQDFFLFFYRYGKLSELTCDHLMTQDVLWQFFQFIVGSKLHEEPTLENTPRRFTTIQTREFGPLQCTMAVLILHLDLVAHSPKALVDEDQYPWIRCSPKPLFSVNDDVAQILSPKYCGFYIREALIALKEVDNNSIFIVVDALVYAAHTLPHFNEILIKQILAQLSSTPGNELKKITRLATQLCLLPDIDQEGRLQSMIAEPSGILEVVRENQITDSQKSYQLIKLLTAASESSELVAQFLVGCAQQWEWCVNWLKKKMSEQTWMSHSLTSNEESLTKTFQRTISAQATLDKATAMLVNTQDVVNYGSDMEVDRDSITSDDMHTAPVDSNQPTES